MRAPRRATEVADQPGVASPRVVRSPHRHVPGAGPSSQAAVALSHALGNRALARIAAQRRPMLARKPARDLLAALPELAGDRWDVEMEPHLEEVQDEFDALDIGHYSLHGNPPSVGPSPGKVFEQFAYHVGMHLGNPEFDKHRRLVAWLLAGIGTPPGVGSLGKMGFDAAQLVSRPGFSTRVRHHRVVPTKARRHITAWHNIRALINKLLRERPAALEAGIDRALLGGIVDMQDREEAERLLVGKPLAYFGTYQAGFARKVLEAAFVMNSRSQNLWVGDTRENSEIARVSNAFQGYIEAFSRSGSTKPLLEAVGGYKVTSPLAVQTKKELLLHALRHTRDLRRTDETVQLMIEELRRLEVDLPNAGMLTNEELAAHNRIFDVLFGGEAIGDQDAEELVYHLMGGPAPRLRSLGERLSSWVWDLVPTALRWW
jgi:hypothetical protein